MLARNSERERRCLWEHSSLLLLLAASRREAAAHEEAEEEETASCDKESKLVQLPDLQPMLAPSASPP